MSSRRVSGRFPPPGTSAVADLIRQRRGARGLTPLDGTLLHVPPIAEGWNSLLGAVRTKGSLPADVREAMILRVAAHNHAAFEWIHHEPVGRDGGLGTAQLRIIRDTSKTAQAGDGGLGALLSAALAFADSSTKSIKASDEVFGTLKVQLATLIPDESPSSSEATKEDRVEDLLVEAAAVVASYNMVSRFLISLDVAGISDNPVPWPVDTHEHRVVIPGTTKQYLHVKTLTADRGLPWLLFINSLLTDHTMWNHLVPYLTRSYNLVLYDQRGHGKSSIPSPPTTDLAVLASDVSLILESLNSPAPIQSIIGVSQGGATALNVGRLYPHLAKSIVACDTQAIGPEANIKAWEERIPLANATSDGMHVLAKATAQRWFPSGLEKGKMLEIEAMISGTDTKGFEAGARALQGYNLVEPGVKEGQGKSLLEGTLPTLLVAGKDDAGGKIGAGLEKLQQEWAGKGGNVEFVGIDGCGHLPMIDGTAVFAEALLKFLGKHL